MVTGVPSNQEAKSSEKLSARNLQVLSNIKKTVSLVTQLCYQMGLNRNAIAVLILFFSKAIAVPILV
jgi:hypothetical protein